MRKNYNRKEDVMPISASAATTYDIWVSQAVIIPSLNKHNTQGNTEHRRLENQNKKNSKPATTTYDIWVSQAVNIPSLLPLDVLCSQQQQQQQIDVDNLNLNTLTFECVNWGTSYMWGYLLSCFLLCFGLDAECSQFVILSLFRDDPVGL